MNPTGGFQTDTLNADLSNFAPWYKHNYQGPVRNGMRLRKYLYDRFLGNGEPFKMQGDKVIMSLETSYNPGFGWQTGNGALPTPGVPTGIRPESIHTCLYAATGFDENTLRLGASAEGAFEEPMMLAMKSLETTGGVVINQALHGDKTGRLARVDGSPALGVITLDNDGLRNSLSGDRTKWIMQGMFVDAVDSTTGLTTQAGMKVESRDPVNDQITVSIGGVVGAGATSDNDYLVRGRELASANDLNAGLEGLSAALGSDTNTYWGIVRSQPANERFRPVRVDFGGGAMDTTSESTREAGMAKIRELIGRIQSNGADEGVRTDADTVEGAVLLTTKGGVNDYGSLLTPQKRFVDAKIVLKGGWNAVEAEGYPLMWDADAPAGYIQFLNLGDFHLGSPAGSFGLEVFNRDGLTLRQVPGYPTWVIYFYGRLQLGCFQPTRSGEVYNIDMTVYPS